MLKATLTSKGQLTVPREIRERLGLSPGDQLVFDIEGESVRVRAEKRRGLEELKGSLPAQRPYPGKEAERDAARRHIVGEVLGRGD